MTVNDRVRWIYSSRNNGELSERYDSWAQTYETELSQGMGDAGPGVAAEVLVKLVPQEATILDAGAGTGVVGQFLHQQGYHNLEALDLSAGMLAEARKKNVYTHLYQKALGDPLDLPSNHYDAIISAGVFTYGHVKSHAFDELIRITKPEGYIIVTMPADLSESDEFKPKLTSLETLGQWKMVSVTEKFRAHQKKDSGVYLKVWTYQVL